MKKMTFLLFCLCFSFANAKAQKHVTHIVASDLDDNIKTPGTIHELTGPPRQVRKKKPTMGIIQFDKEDTETRGPVTEVSRGEVISVYQIGDTMFYAPTSQYKMKNGILYDARSNNLECITVDLKSSDCKIKDLVTIGNETYKNFYSTDEVIWTTQGSYLVPGIKFVTIDTLETSRYDAYLIGVETVEGTVCDLFWLNPSLDNSATFWVDLERGDQFERGTDKYTFNGEEIVQFFIFKQHRLPKGSMQTRHKKRTKV